MTDGPGAFGRLLQQYRQAARLSQEDLAERAGLSRRGISDLERGARRAPYPSTVRSLAQALGLGEAEHARLLRAGGRYGQVTPGLRDSHLPIALSSFVGRHSEVSELQRLLPSVRLLTLVGPGGIGKTRLALAVAEPVEREAAFVDLALLDRTAIVAAAIAVALGIVGTPGQDLSTLLTAALQDQATLLVLDNCEHVLASCAGVVDDLLRACPLLRVLATSREPLGVAGEIVWSVPPLVVPDPSKRLSLEQTAEIPAVRLFLERVRASLPEFELGASRAPYVADICRRLDGIPLALELAAARVRVMGVVELARRLDSRLRLLVGGDRTAAPRQQTLRATLDWSYGLLSEPERALFARLGVFSGGWTSAAAEAICAGDGIPRENVLPVLGQLVDRSLVSIGQAADGGVRYRMLESVRDYARECAAGLAETEAIEQRHAAYYRALAEQADEGIWGPDQRDWMACLTSELGNVRAALEWSASADGDAELGLRLAASLWFFWVRSGLVRDARVYLARLLARYSAPTWVRTWGLHAAAHTAWFDGDNRSARAYLDEALLLALAEPDTRTSAWLYIGLGSVALTDNDVAAAQAFLRHGLTLGRGVGDPRAVYVPLSTLAQVARAQGDLDRAERLLQHAAFLIRAHGDLHAQCWAASWLGHLALVRGDLAQAASLQLESVAAHRGLGGTLGVSHNLDELAQVALAAGDLPRAARLFGAAAGQRAWASGEPYPLASAERESALASARQGLGEAAFEAAWRVGHELSLDEALTDAEALPRQVASPAGPDASRSRVPSDQEPCVEDTQVDAEAPDAAELERIACYTRQVRARLGNT